mgnify:CR=1 FL=1
MIGAHVVEGCGVFGILVGEELEVDGEAEERLGLGDEFGAGVLVAAGEGNLLEFALAGGGDLVAEEVGRGPAEPALLEVEDDVLLDPAVDDGFETADGGGDGVSA